VTFDELLPHPGRRAHPTPPVQSISALVALAPVALAPALPEVCDRKERSGREAPPSALVLRRTASMASTPHCQEAETAGSNPHWSRDGSRERRSSRRAGPRLPELPGVPGHP
jgi:hypothetical protein